MTKFDISLLLTVRRKHKFKDMECNGIKTWISTFFDVIWLLKDEYFPYVKGKLKLKLKTQFMNSCRH